ncbi:acyltransferase [Marinoscillum sp. MHG1-6]|uniref:acyltransferase n=1 Tax=Marinoscillum sp. MHG1-6 TaxID=2959627 RepID=UPI002157D991|nr:acyltransferase [Marinoscillum sp. MHG1-6]
MDFIKKHFWALKEKYNRNNRFIRSLRKQGAKVGERVQIVDAYGFLYEPWTAYLIEIGSDVIISSGVRFVNHDSSYSNIIKGYDKVRYGVIRVNNNVYIGVNSIVMPGVEICSDVIVGANSLINKTITESGIYVGSPARKISNLPLDEELNKKTVDRTKSFIVNLPGQFEIPSFNKKGFILQRVRESYRNWERSRFESDD